MDKEIRILIIEDEPIIAEDLAFMLEEMGYNHSTICHDANSAIENLKDKQYDLALIDINLDNNTNGIDVGKYLHSNLQAPFIYLTSLSDTKTVENVKNTFPSGYLIKPIDENELRVNIEMALFSFNENQKESNYPEFIYVKDNHTYVKVKVSDILFLEGSNNYTIIHTNDRKLVISQTLKTVAQKMDSSLFVRVHKSAVVSLKNIEKISDAKISIKDHEVPIGRTYRSEFFSRIDTI